MINQAIQLAQLFGNLLTMADYSMACALLSPERQRQYPPMEPNDVVWLYVSLEGEDFVEAVSVIIEDREGKLAIRWLEWGRP
ncbi:ssr5092 (plasmid) [Synechocystis sp. PCC 6803]|uniref:Ssr5092 protein n=1 Tax=Synechocystis sp. (strain ATCC 27184 / PCC 6803 / Kazusa) TaxID=1111708 RepID=Q6ZEN8_SYNY3|nr:MULTISPECIES: hypothetical protein [unclassified Synechocystis]AGF53519.1 hypothetical protein MYO_2930 [Synechocystis sp. PCC 6803]AVP91639.1 hypothetical protein C7I86_17920 [Synechocystis sp. IPPAS B-1465]MBD2619918.1 hypothetical protein [Synechocystis sp. FACHB-898]MBD2640791.1 hypothetical protein [Synechocystis sp. FACHB-908]MBD2662801.1 hypothetical protein [Synechocystis sp. FACHB-929]